MDCFDKVEELLLAEGYTKEEIPAIMVSLVEQGLDPTSVVLGGLANMFGWLPKKKVEPKKVEPKKVQPKTPSWGPENVKGPSQPNFVTGSGKISKPISTGKGSPWMVKLDPVPAASSKLPQPPKPPVTPPGQMQIPGTSARAQDLRNVTRNPNLGLPGNRTGFAFDTGEIAKQSRAPKPAWTGSSGSGQGFPKPPIVSRDAGSWARQRMLLKPPAPTAPTAPTGIFGRIKNLRGTTPAQLALNLAAGEALDRYVTQPVAKAGGSALTRSILDATGKGEKARQINPQLYGKSGPTLTPEIMKAVQQRSKLKQQKAETQAASQPKPTETRERSAAANAAKQETAKAEAQRRRASAADFDKTFAAKRAAGEKEFTWRGRRYSTKLK